MNKKTTQKIINLINNNYIDKETQGPRSDNHCWRVLERKQYPPRVTVLWYDGDNFGKVWMDGKLIADVKWPIDVAEKDYTPTQKNMYKIIDACELAHKKQVTLRVAKEHKLLQSR